MTFTDAAAAVQAVEVGKLKAPGESCASPESGSLVLRAQAGDTYAFEQLMICHQRQVLCTAARILRRYEDAKDVAQEVFLKLYRYLPRIRPESVRSWLYQVTVNACRDMARKSEQFPMAALEDHIADRGLSVESRETIEAGIALAERREMLQDALLSLPFKERAALVLRDIEGLSTDETAAALGSSATTIRSQISSARVKVRRHCERALGRER
jgi:RNA polymerase sigma-70 factor, ECF subfamily